MTRVRFLWVTLRSDAPGFALLAFALALGVGALCLFGTLGTGMQRALRDLFPDAERTLQVTPARLALGGLSAKLDDATVRKLRAMPGVASASPRMLLRVPAVSFYHGNFFGHPLDFAVEIAAQGVEPGAIGADLPPGESFDDADSGAIPACISDRLLAIYNGTFAPARGLPQLSPKLLLGFDLPVTIGRTFFSEGARTSQTIAVRVVCVSPRALLAGLTLPLDSVKRLNRLYGQDEDSYSSVSVMVESPAELERLRTRISDLGLAIDDTEASTKALGRAAAIAALALLALGALILLMAVGSIALALTLSVCDRSAEIGLLRALGATSADVAALVLMQAAAIGLVGGLLGVALAGATERWLGHLLDRFGSGLPNSVETMFAFDARVAGAALVVGVLAAVGGAYLPARAAARLDPARAMAS